LASQTDKANTVKIYTTVTAGNIVGTEKNTITK